MQQLRKVLYTGGSLSDQWVTRFQNQGFEVDIQSPNLSEEELIQALDGKDAYILAGLEKVTAKVIAATSSLKVIAFLGVGYASFIDEAAATEAGILITNAPGTNAQAVAEYTFGLILNAVRAITYSATELKKGNWIDQPSWNLHGKTLGIIGMGNIGSKVAKMGKFGFGMNIVYFSRSRHPDKEKELEAKYLPLSELFQTADVLSIHLPYQPETINLIDESKLALMKSSAVIVNASRAEIINPEALRTSLLNHRPACIAMDGYYIEPAPNSQNDPFHLLTLNYKQVIITPHTAYNTKDSMEATLNTNLQSLSNIFQTGHDKHIVNLTVAANYRS